MLFCKKNPHIVEVAGIIVNLNRVLQITEESNIIKLWYDT